jgi:HD superfamily phosphohydrolase
MSITLDNLRHKGIEISEEEYEAGLIAILLHDIGHGPFSHALEFSILQNIPHESLSLLVIQRLNREFDNKLDLAIKIFKGEYERKFFNQLVSSQLDIDRLDYLQRDCFFTGVSEGAIGADRIIKMMDIKDDRLVIEEKGIYSIENFLSARRLMYWQVYLHKTTVSAEKMMISLINRAKYLMQNGQNLIATNELCYFLKGNFTLNDFKNNEASLENFLTLDDFDIWGAIKLWKNSEDYILKNLSSMFLDRNLFKINLRNEEFSQAEIEEERLKLLKKLQIPESDLPYFFNHGVLSNHAYLNTEQIFILTKKGNIIDVALAADLPNIKAMSKIVKKHYICHAKNLTL